MSVTPSRTPTIPSAFRRSDDSVTAADAYVNQRDLQVAAQNHNVLIARRARQPLLAMSFQADALSVTGPLVGSSQPGSGSLALGPVPLYVPPHCQSVRVVIYARDVSGVGGTVEAKLFPVVTTWQTAGSGRTNATSGIASAVLARYSADAPVPSDAALVGLGWLWLFIESEIETSDKGANATVLASGADWARVTGAYSAWAVGDVAYIPSDATITPRAVLRVDATGEDSDGDGSNDVIVYTAEPWNHPPVVGDTFNARQPIEVEIRSVSVFPLAVTDFDDQVDR